MRPTRSAALRARIDPLLWRFGAFTRARRCGFGSGGGKGIHTGVSA